MADDSLKDSNAIVLQGMPIAQELVSLAQRLQSALSKHLQARRDSRQCIQAAFAADLSGPSL
jgi:hypothetical protein